MNKKDIIIGLLLGLLLGFVGFVIVISLLSESGTSLMDGFTYMRNIGSIGKVITLGAIPNLVLFFILLNKNKDLMAKGVILSMFVLIIISLLL